MVASATTAADADPTETQEWLDALEAVVRRHGKARGVFLLSQLEEQARQLDILTHALPYSSYRNTIALEQQAVHPGDVALEERLTAILRWNALAMVVRANEAYGELGGHVASYASAAEIFEVGFNHFFRADSGEERRGDLVFFQPHSAPGVYARAFLEGRLSEDQLALTLKDTLRNLFQLRLQPATERLETPSEIKKAKKDIARMKTIQRERELAAQSRSAGEESKK